MVKVFIFIPSAGQPQSAANTVTLSNSNIVKLRIGKMDKHFFKIYPNTIKICLCSAHSRLGCEGREEARVLSSKTL